MLASMEGIPNLKSAGIAMEVVASGCSHMCKSGLECKGVDWKFAKRH